MDEGTRVPDLSRPFGRADLGSVYRRTRLQSHAISRARHRGLDAAVRGHHSVRYAVAQINSAAAIDPFPAHAGAVRVFLRMLPFQHLPDVRSDIQPSRHLGRRDEEALHHGGIHGLRLDDPAGNHVHGRLDSPDGRTALPMLHRAIYLTAIAGVIHFYWLVKSDIHLPLEYAAVMAILLGWRVYDHYSKAPRSEERRV